MSGWIKFEKDLRTDPRVLRMARALNERFALFDVATAEDFDPRNACALPAVTLVLGALAQLWSLADSHAEEDILGMSEAELDEYLGIPGLCALMPRDWLQVLDEHSIELPGFQAHNGPEAKARAVTQKRVERHRTRNAAPLPQRNARPLPDKTRPDQTRLDQTLSEGGGVVAPQKAREGAEAPLTKPNPYATMSIALRGKGVNVTSDHPTLVAWVDDKYSVEHVLGAVAKARETKGDNERISAAYLDPIVRAPKRLNGNGAGAAPSAPRRLSAGEIIEQAILAGHSDDEIVALPELELWPTVRRDIREKREEIAAHARN